MLKKQDFWARKYEQNIGRMTGICNRYVSDPQLAEDLAHEAFLSAIEKADTFKGLGSFDGWMSRIAVNTALGHLRKSHRFVDVNEVLPEVDKAVEKEELSLIEQADFTQAEIIAAIKALPEQQRAVFNLFVFEDQSHKKIAEMLSIAERTSKLRLAQARKMLQDVLVKKAKHKKIWLMMFLFSIFKKGHAVDNACRRTLKDYSVEPATPPSSVKGSWKAAATPSIWLRFPALKWLAAVGLPAVLMVGATAYFVVKSHNDAAHPSSSPLETPVPVTVSSDTLCANDDSESESDATPTAGNRFVAATSSVTTRADSTVQSQKNTEPVIIRDTIIKTVVKVVHDTVYLNNGQ